MITIKICEDVSKNALLIVISSFKKDKSHGVDGWIVDFYLGFLDLSNGDLIKGGG